MEINTTHIWTDPDRCGGRPCIRGHRLTLAQMLAELSEGRSIQELEADFRLEEGQLAKALSELADFV